MQSGEKACGEEKLDISENKVCGEHK